MSHVVSKLETNHIETVGLTMSSASKQPPRAMSKITHSALKEGLHPWFAVHI